MFFSTSGRTFRFGHFELDTLAQELRKKGTRVPLAPKPFAVLVYLVSRPQQLVTRVRLQRLVWGRRSTINVESALNACVTKIRRALGWEDGASHFIQTINGEGYRFLAPVEVIETTRPWQGLAAAKTWLRKRQADMRKRWQRLRTRW